MRNSQKILKVWLTIVLKGSHNIQCIDRKLLHFISKFGGEKSPNSELSVWLGRPNLSTQNHCIFLLGQIQRQFVLGSSS